MSSLEFIRTLNHEVQEDSTHLSSKERAQNSLTQRLKSDYLEQMTQKFTSTATSSLLNPRPSFSLPTFHWSQTSFLFPYSPVNPRHSLFLSTALHLNIHLSSAPGASKWTHPNSHYQTHSPALPLRFTAQGLAPYLTGTPHLKTLQAPIPTP